MLKGITTGEVKMPERVIFRRGDIVKITLPGKLKKGANPLAALVVSSDWYNDYREDVITLEIRCTNLGPERDDYELDTKDLRFGKLPEHSLVKLGKVMTVPKRFVAKTERRLPDETVRKIIQKFSREILAELVV
ncbi:MAG: type II toxin-antitoxin system PemK/MazF family toxin [Candidatus Hadarchaeota archaeon]